MPTRERHDTAPAAAARRAGRAWSHSSQPPEARSSGFGTTVFDVVNAAATLRPDSGSAFDVCHVGAVLRALLFVHTVVGVAVVFGANSFASWLALVASASSVALPAVLLWLLVACGLKRPLGALPLQAQWVAAIALGAFSAGVSAQLLWTLTPDAPLAGPAIWRAPAAGGGAAWPALPGSAWLAPWSSSVSVWLAPALTGGVSIWLAPALSGGAIAAVIFQWLHMRAQARLPAETTARLAELQSRIRPHFLFNTLNTALTLVRLDPARAEAVLEDLAELFRVAISDSGESVSLAEEVELAQRYLAIEQLRFGTRLQVDWDLDAAAGGARVPPLLLQPLVENAVRHGIEPAADGGVIRVRTRVRHGRAVVSIANSVSAEPSRPGHGIALHNVRERLRLMHDVAAQFETRHDARVFRVQVVVPL